MPKITDPDKLNQGTEIEFLTGSQTGSSQYNLIKLNVAGELSASTGVGMQAIYSFIKEEWRTDDNLIKFPIPMLAITSEQFEIQNGWDLSGSFSKYLIRDAGWALKDSDGGSNEEWMNLTTLGSFVTGSDQSYFLQLTGSGDTPEDIQLSGEVNQGILIFASASEEYADRDSRGTFKIFLRERGKTYDSYNLLQEQNLATLTYRKFALPLANTLDTKITSTSDNEFTASAPVNFAGMTIEYFTESFVRDIGGTDYPFKVLITNTNGDAEDIYEFTQFKLRQTSDIDDGTNLTEDIRGDIADQLLVFVGDNLITQNVTFGDNDLYSGGVYIDNFLAADTNRITFTDDSGSGQTFPFVAAGELQFDTNLTSDPSSSYWVFFTNDDAPGDDLGRDFGTDAAILIDDNSDNPITGSVDGSGSIEFDFDYDGNIQRGSSTSASVAPFTAVALGLETAQYVLTTGNITRSTSNIINFVAALERNYLNE